MKFRFSSEDKIVVEELLRERGIEPAFSDAEDQWFSFLLEGEGEEPLTQFAEIEATLSRHGFVSVIVEDDLIDTGESDWYADSFIEEALQPHIRKLSDLNVGFSGPFDSDDIHWHFNQSSFPVVVVPAIRGAMGAIAKFPAPPHLLAIGCLLKRTGGYLVATDGRLFTFGFEQRLDLATVDKLIPLFAGLGFVGEVLAWSRKGPSYMTFALSW
jgi:hypothetical protein